MKRHLKIRRSRGVNGLVGVDYYTDCRDAWCTGKCDDCGMKFVCYTTPKNDHLIVDSGKLDKVNYDHSYD
jgi:hypothetical protein